jgi:general L-amino acid transport system permease protein
VSSRAGESWNDPRTRAIVWQAVAVLAVGTIVCLVGLQAAANLHERGIASGFGYLGRAAGFEISPRVIAYSPRDTYARALQVGLVNTLRVAMIAIAIASALGVLIGIARLSSIRVVSTIASGYVEVMRNTPLLLQILFWYSLWRMLPAPANAFNPLPGTFLCIRGLYLPTFAGWFDLEYPVLAGFNFHGGTCISPEFAALLTGLSTSAAALIGEIVRSGILAVPKGQMEAAAALGLSRARILRLVVLPQALRVIIPPTTSQFVNIAKNSSLAVAIGYPDVISVTNTTLNQTGQAVEAIAVAMLVYLTMGAVISVLMNLYNRSVAGSAAQGLHA